MTHADATFVRFYKRTEVSSQVAKECLSKKFNLQKSCSNLVQKVFSEVLKAETKRVETILH